MKIGYLKVLFAAFMTLMLASGAQAACKQKLYASVRVEFNDNGGIMVPVRVDGQGVWMVLDLAGGIPSVFQKTAEQLGLKVVRAGDIDATAGGRKIEHKVVIGSLAIGGANFTKWDLFVLPGTEAEVPQFKGSPVLGGLTSRFMTVVDVELNLAERQINLFSQTRCGTSAVYWGGEVASADLYHDGSGLMLFPMEVDGRRVETAFRTQAATSQISEAVTSRFFGFDRESDGITREQLPGGREIASFRAMGLTSRGLDMKNVPVRLLDDRDWNCAPSTSDRNSRAIGFSKCMSRAPLSVGTDLLRKLRVYIAPREGKIYFTRAGETAPAAAP